MQRHHGPHGGAADAVEVAARKKRSRAHLDGKKGTIPAAIAGKSAVGMGALPAFLSIILRTISPSCTHRIARMVKGRPEKAVLNSFMQLVHRREIGTDVIRYGA